MTLIKWFIIGLTFIGIFLGIHSASFGKPKPLKVMIDPGHGGDDLGARHNGAIEKDLVLAISQKLHQLLKKDNRFEVSMTRSHDQYLALDERSKKAETMQADIFVSIHGNSSDVKSAKGTEIYFENQTPTDDESMRTAARENAVKKPQEAPSENSDVGSILQDLNHSAHMELSSVLAQNILESLQKNMGVKTRAIRQAPFHVLSVTMPATLIETGFISNPAEAELLKTPQHQAKLAKAIYLGLIRYKEKLDKVPVAP